MQIAAPAVAPELPLTLKTTLPPRLPPTLPPTSSLSPKRPPTLPHPDSPQEGAAAPGRLKGVGKAPPHPKAAMVPTPFLLIDLMHVFLVCAGGMRSERKGPGANQAD